MSILFTTLLVLLLVLASAIFSGLNIALMSLDPSELRRQIKLGNKAAAKVLPYRVNIHLALASILLSNIGVISTTSLVLDEHLSGVAAGALSTLLIVIFGEVVPQAIFAKNALPWTARFSWVLKLTSLVAYPVAKPLQLLLDKLVGHNASSRLYGREELGMMITEHAAATNSELDEDEVEILRSVLQQSEKRVSSIMTPVEQVYWLDPATVLTKRQIDEIISRGYSRIRIFEPDLSRCNGLLLLKDLIENDHTGTPAAVGDMPLHPVKFVGSRTALDTLFRRFTNSHTHLLPVKRRGVIIGIVTIEDLIEEIIGHEIQDETDHQKNRA